MNRIKSNRIPSRQQGPLLLGEGRPPRPGLGAGSVFLVGSPPGLFPSWWLSVTPGRSTDLQEDPSLGGVCSGQSKSDSICSLTFRHQSPPVT